MQYSTLYHLYTETRKVTTDSRKVEPGSIFFALKGDRFNGNDFAMDCLEKGASYAVVDEDRDEFGTNHRIIRVEDALLALQNLAREHRHKLKIPVIGLTGSNGKTTSKELLKAALERTYTTYATRGNLNNHIGVPLSILEIMPDHEIAIIEMGANHQKEIEFLCTISHPDAGFITNIGLAHLEGFGGEEGVYIGKKELYDYLIKEDGKLFINCDDPKVVRASQGNSGVKYGKGEDCHFQGEYRIEDNRLVVDWWRDIDTFKRTIRTQLTGAYNFSNVLAAVAVGRYYGVPDSDIKKGIEAYRPSNNRSQVEQSERGNTLIVDCYNANPSSMIAAIENLSLEARPKKVALVGDMLELGDASKVKHQEIVDLLRSKDIEAHLVGEHFGRTEHSGFAHYPTTADLAKKLGSDTYRDAVILLKGSRRMKLEDLLELL